MTTQLAQGSLESLAEPTRLSSRGRCYVVGSDVPVFLVPGFSRVGSGPYLRDANVRSRREADIGVADAGSPEAMIAVVTTQAAQRSLKLRFA